MEEHSEDLSEQKVPFQGADKLALTARFVFPRQFSDGKLYGTVSSTIIKMDDASSVTMIERSWARLFLDHPDLLHDKAAFLRFCTAEERLAPYETIIRFDLLSK